MGFTLVFKMEETDLSEPGPEDLDYHIHFPSPGPDEIHHEDEELFNPNAVLKEPVVILLGWMGCQDKDLEMYSAIYEHKKSITIRYTLSMDKLLYNRNLVRPIATKILELIEDLSLEESPILFHVMSNGGCILYRHITQEIQNNSRFSMLHVRGCVFDSCPSVPRLSTAVSDFKNNIQLNFVAAYFMTMLFAFYIYAKNLLKESMRMVSLLDVAEENYYTALEKDPAPWPQLFLYSQSDNLVPYQDIDHMIAARQKLGVLVLSTCWEDSMHVQHLMSHRDSYVKQCYDFLDICLAGELEDPERSISTKLM